MDALRCTNCGDTRWSLTGFATVVVAAVPRHRCELCGGAMVRERRQPNQGPLQLLNERRDVGAPIGGRFGHRPLAKR
jgi:hypothetical protein